MKNIFLYIIVFNAFFLSAKAQGLDAYVHKAEYGLSVGLANYFGDLNNTPSFSKPKFAASVFYKKQINNYIGIKFSGSYAFLGYADKYSSNTFQQTRNLSFNTDVWEAAISGEFNFFKFYPGIEEYRYTPYLSIGVGAISYDPYTYLAGEKYFLRGIGTEGQGNALYPGTKPYNAIAVVIPFGFGIKYNLNPKINVFAELNFRFTTTDYLDDVSGNYAPDAFPLDANGNPTIGFLLQDRSYELGPTIGTKGRQRGNSNQRDAFATFQLGISLNIQSYLCPKY